MYAIRSLHSTCDFEDLWFGDVKATSREFGGRLVEAALAYAREGWAVFPLHTRGKTPITPHGHLDATTDPDRAAVQEWMDNLSETPQPSTAEIADRESLR